ncbi:MULTISPECIES: ABC-three component system protein [unclassified Halomonas]|uniref:ABC-three component system protein n=1 Tax=unclassified Halomonas TaxID=2609666 RepID=UPI000485F513|nr:MULTISPECIES: ABC-three component system protein [unclassified Halomonas]PKH63108.1 HNH endonuclease [Halomonas sp. Choline-3u-9]QGQ71877.1 HNH endonuclease [Halomonas sp. PA16-9]
MANMRVKYHPNEHSILYGETGGACPLCGLPMMFKKASSKHPSIGYEIAHIYPLNANASQAEALTGYAEPAEINGLENVILLCPTCHTKYDKDFKIEEYCKLLDIKKNYLSEAEAKLTASQYEIQDEVHEILDLIVNNDNDYGDLSATELNVSSLHEKLKTGISPLQKRDIRSNAIDFFVPIRNKIRLIEQRDQVAIRILQNQINTYYLIINRKNPGNKDIVFNHIAQWISLKTGKSIIASRVLTSFFVQNCEVFDADSN